MYLAILLSLSAAALFVLARGIRGRRPAVVAFGVALLAAVILFFATLDLWGEWLWFEALGFSGRFWTVLLTKLGLAVIGALLAALLTSLLTAPAARASALSRLWPPIGAGVLAAFWGAASWREALLWREGVPTAVQEPILGRDTGFYLFKLPFYDRVFVLLVLIALFALCGSAASFLSRARTGRLALRARPGKAAPGQVLSLRLSFGFLVTLLGFGA